jgi:hypothetical protein
METWSLGSQGGPSRDTGKLESWLQEQWEPGLGAYLGGRKLYFHQLVVPSGPSREHVLTSNRDGQVGLLDHNQFTK